VGAPLPPQMHTLASAAGRVPSVAALPGGGFLYVDETNDLVRQVSASGKTTTVAGNGTNIDAPDGTPAVNSGLNDPVAVAPLPGGGFLVTEYAGSMVRMVSPGTPGTATIATIAGTGAPGNNGGSGAATAIQLNYPTDAEITADGRVLIADRLNHEIRILSAAAPGATINTIAGGGTCVDAAATCDGTAADAVALADPVSVSPLQGGADGYLITEYNTDAVRKVSDFSPTGTFTTVAGVPGQPGYSGDGGPATSALLDHPEQVFAAPDGSFMVSDTNNERVRLVSPAGTITTVAGNGVASYAGDGGDATAASLNGPAGVAPAHDGGFVIADANDDAIREVTIPPTTTIAPRPLAPNGRHGWYISAVQVIVSATNAASIGCDLDLPAPPVVFDELDTPCIYTGDGDVIATDGTYTFWAASMDAFGDKELPVTATVKVDLTSPAVTCPKTPSFPLDARRERVSAAVSDRTSGPLSAHVSARAKTSTWGRHTATLTGFDQAGNMTRVGCSYFVEPLAFRPVPAIKWTIAVGGGHSRVVRLAVIDLAAHAAVNVRCQGTGCPFSLARNVTGRLCGAKPCAAKTSQQRRSRRTVVLTPLFAHVQLGAGARLSISVTRPNTIGRVWLLTMGSGRPSQRVGCLTPGSLVTSTAC
ncbi:MAG TPA: hypothetical protein VMU39_11185, partial [Solirubrobacteraceae bacterium]|nr:hypothetical protein [Solirubrobacteraceae bacterium]